MPISAICHGVKSAETVTFTLSDATQRLLSTHETSSTPALMPLNSTGTVTLPASDISTAFSATTSPFKDTLI